MAGPYATNFSNSVKTASFKRVDEVDMPAMHRSTYSLAETFDMGRDTGTQVSIVYTDPFVFKGDLDKVVITLLEKPC